MSIIQKSQRFLTFSLDKELYALDINSVREILDVTEITRIPHAPAYMLGVVNLRGNAVPVMDLRLRFGLPHVEQTLNTRIIIMEFQHGHGVSLIGAMADSVKEVLELDPSQTDAPPRMGSAISADFITGIGKHNDRFVLLLDAGKVFTTEQATEALAVLEA